MSGSEAERIAKEIVSRFPIKAAVVPDTSVAGSTPYNVGVPEYQVSLNKTAPDGEVGRYDAKIHIASKVALSGFKGGIYSIFKDERGNIIYAMQGDAYGVNGTTIPGADDVTKLESKTIPLALLTALYSVEVFPARLEDDALHAVEEKVKELAKGLDVIKDGLQKIVPDVLAIGSAIKALL